MDTGRRIARVAGGKRNAGPTPPRRGASTSRWSSAEKDRRRSPDGMGLGRLGYPGRGRGQLHRLMAAADRVDIDGEVAASRVNMRVRRLRLHSLRDPEFRRRQLVTKPYK